MNVSNRTSLTRQARALLDKRVKIVATGEVGVIRNVMPDANGDVYSIHVKVDGETTPRILALDEVVDAAPVDVN